MKKVTIIIPNYNGLRFMEDCFQALDAQTYKDFDVLVVDNASTDGSVEWLEQKGITTLKLEKNMGFAGGVNAGLRMVTSDYVILLNNDTAVFPDYVKELVNALERSGKIFSVNPMMINMNAPELMDDGGDGMCILGWPYQIGVGEKTKYYGKRKMIFSACAGASIYRKSILDEIGYFDEMHFAYLEDIDLGYRARLVGYINVYEPKAKVYHYGSGTSGSKYNAFKVKLAARNHIFLHYKNQCNLQLLVNSLPLLLGIFIKLLFFCKKGFGREYIEGIREGMRQYKKCRRVKHVPAMRYLAVEFEMILGMLDYTLHFINRRLRK